MFVVKGWNAMKKALLVLLLMLGMQAGLTLVSVSPTFADPCCNKP